MWRNIKDDLFTKAYANYEAKEHELAIKNINLFIANNFNNTSALILRGMIRLNQELFNEAISDFDRAIKLKSTEANWYFLRASAYIKLKNWSCAQIDIQKASSLDPEESIYQNYLFMVDMIIEDNIEIDFDKL